MFFHSFSAYTFSISHNNSGQNQISPGQKQILPAQGKYG